MLSAPHRPNGCVPAEGGAQQLVNLAARLGGGHAVVELDLDEPHEERIERSAGCQELLGDLGEWPSGRDHAGKRRHLTAGALDVSDGSRPVPDTHPAHGETNAAPVMPAAAWPGKVQMKVCVPA